jgi:hypothetical protein
MNIKNIERIEELKRNEELLYKCIEYLVELWRINDKDMIERGFEKIGFTKEDIKRLEIGNEY